MKKQKSKGRPSMTEGKRAIMVNARFTNEEYQNLLDLEKELGLSRADLIRSRVLHNAPQKIINARQMIGSLDAIGTEMGHAGNNINQLARYANILRKKGILSPIVIESFSLLMETYLGNQIALEAVLRKLMRMMSQA
ncbi:plasmid mobilization protein [Mucilaginibacter sp. UYCu711]|uniref:plasmid mobilization protein n=1 Tax=Mucilaginibacter sp. UYCu711 TaxID=3156339 RepID=UPI003D253702